MLHNVAATAQSLSPFEMTYYLVIFTLALLTAIALWPVFAKAGVAAGTDRILHHGLWTGEVHRWRKR